MTGSKQNSKHKDALFKVVFGENRQNALSLYNAINNTNYTNEEDLEILVLRDTVYIGIKNDASFLFNHEMNLYEHQSKYCPNMPLRGLGYFADLYKMFLGGEDASAIRMYDTRQLRIPTPKYYVFYNGVSEMSEREDVCLSDAYEGSGDVEVVAHMINVNKGHNESLMQHCKPMADYSEFIFRVRESVGRGSSKEEAVAQAVNECIRDGILADLLRKERARVENILIRGLSEEEEQQLKEMQINRALKEGREKGREEGLKEGREEGIKEGRYEAVLKIVEGGLCDEKQACELLGVDYKTYKTEVSGCNSD